MKTTELRLNNWVQDKNAKFPMQVVGIYSDGVYLDFEGNEGDMWEEKEEDIEGIKLTEDILVKCGFVCTTYLGDTCKCSYLKSSAKVQMRIELLKHDNVFKMSLKGVYVCVRYLHQLQNLIFALTGEELTVNL